MQITVSNEVLSVDDGSYTATIETLHSYNDGENILMKLKLDNDLTLVKFYRLEEFSGYPWSNVFRALGTNETDDIIGKTVEIHVENRTSEKTGKSFCNIKKVTLV